MGIKRHLIYPGEARRITANPVDASAGKSMSGISSKRPAYVFVAMLIGLAVVRVIYEMSPAAD